MKNREKYREEILEEFATSFDFNIGCSFTKKHIIPYYDPEKRAQDETCRGITCPDCAKMFAFWLEEEYVEPPKPEVDWSKVPVDTLVRVRDFESDEWVLKYFKGIDEYNKLSPYVTWANGATSVTAPFLLNDTTHWCYCELVEDEDDK